MTFEKWEAMNKRVNRVLKVNKKLYKLFAETESLFNQFNDFFCLKELLVHHLVGDEIGNLTLKRETKKFLKGKLKDLKLRKAREDREAERIRAIFGGIEKSNHSEWDDEIGICLTDDEFPF